MRIFKTPRLIRYVYKRITWGFSISEPTVYLTFDDGPNPNITPWILDELKKHDFKATFFCVGENVKRYPAIYKRILKEGHAVGNHTMKHENGLKVSVEKYMESVGEASKLIDSKLFRPPYGKITPSLVRKLKKEYRIILWSWLSYDYDAKVSIDKIIEQANRIQAGDILVLHDNDKLVNRQKDLLPKLIELLKVKKLKSNSLNGIFSPDIN
jgi:peptidoglycan/xylan/chitin deacetylase (PgdA/CDA1 family)